MRTNFFDFVRQSRYWKVATSIETFKFTLYLGIPVAASVFYADADFMHGLVKRLNYIRYPKEGQKPSIEMIENERELAKKLRAVLEKYKKN